MCAVIQLGGLQPNYTSHKAENFLFIFSKVSLFRWQTPSQMQFIREHDTHIAPVYVELKANRRFWS